MTRSTEKVPYWLVIKRYWRPLIGTCGAWYVVSECESLLQRITEGMIRFLYDFVRTRSCILLLSLNGTHRLGHLPQRRILRHDYLQCHPRRKYQADGGVATVAGCHRAARYATCASLEPLLPAYCAQACSLVHCFATPSAVAIPYVDRLPCVSSVPTLIPNARISTLR